MIKKHILIVDDDENFREIFKIALQTAGFEVSEAKGGKESLELLKTIKPDVILLDFNMPQMDGVDIFFALKSNNETKNIKIIFLTNIDNFSENLVQYHKKLATEIGVVDYLPKYLDLEKIINIIKEKIEEGETKEGINK